MMHALSDKMPSTCILKSPLCQTLLRKHCWDLLQMTQQSVRQGRLTQAALAFLDPKRCQIWVAPSCSPLPEA